MRRGQRRTSARSSIRARHALCALFLTLGSCASIELRQSTKTSGTFTSTGFAFTMLSIDIPKTAEQIAQENAADAHLANMVVDDVYVFPYLGPVDFLLDILGFRYARVTGTWGFPGE